MSSNHVSSKHQHTSELLDNQACRKLLLQTNGLHGMWASRPGMGM